LGVRNSSLLLTTTAVRSAMALRKSKLINFRMFWNTNYERALFARDLAQTMHADSDLAFAGAMLQDFLLPILTSELLDFYVKFSERSQRESLSLAAFERQTWRWDHALAAGQFMQNWHFPDDLICCVLYHHHGLDILSDPALGRTALGPVAIAGLLPDFFRQTADGLERLIKLDVAWPAFRLHERLKRVAAQFQETQLAGSSGHITFLNRYEKKLAAKI
jgi:serine/threonine-protein kinase